jgi:hypothetical protein
MNCKSCSSQNHRQFSSEINVHFSGLRNIDKPTVFIFPNLLVCMDCGFTEFDIPESELRLLGKEAAACGSTGSPTLEGSKELSDFVPGLPFCIGKIETREGAADKPLALKNGFYRH